MRNIKYINLLFICLWFNLNANSQCELNDQIEIINVLDEEKNIIEISDEAINGIKNNKLEVKATLNGNVNTIGALDSLMLTLIPEEEFRNETYKVFEVNFVITPDGNLINLTLTSELIWFSINEDGSTLYENIATQDPMEAEMTKSMLAYIELEKINEIKSKIKAQKWSPGYCNDNPINTLMTITLNDL
jgi:hypothetical protein